MRFRRIGEIFRPAGRGISLGGVNYLVYDTFTDDNDVKLVDHTPNVDSVGTGWETIGTYMIDWIITDNEADPVSGTDADQPTIIDAGAHDVEISFEVFHNESGLIGAYLAYNADGYYYMWFHDSTNVHYISEVDSGGYTQRATVAQAGIHQVWTTIMLRVVGDTVTLFVDGEQKLQASGMDTENSDGTKFGVFSKLDTENRFRNFTITPL